MKMASFHAASAEQRAQQAKEPKLELECRGTAAVPKTLLEIEPPFCAKEVLPNSSVNSSPNQNSYSTPPEGILDPNATALRSFLLLSPSIAIMEKKMETTIVIRGYIGVPLGLYWDNGKMETTIMGYIGIIRDAFLKGLWSSTRSELQIVVLGMKSWYETYVHAISC